jgi:hypothetical protein
MTRSSKLKLIMPDDAKRRRALRQRASMIQRCYNPKVNVFKWYGARGIGVCREWRDSSASFLRYVQTLPRWDDPTLDLGRIDIRRGFEPGNIRFNTEQETINNRQTALWFEAENSRLARRVRELERLVARTRAEPAFAE